MRIETIVGFIILMSLVFPQASEPMKLVEPPHVLSLSMDTIRDGIEFTVAVDRPALILLQIYTMSGMLVGQSSAAASPASAVKVSAKASDGDGDHIVFLRIKASDGTFLRLRAKIDLPGIIDPPDFPPLLDMRRFDATLSGSYVYLSALPISNADSIYPNYPAYYVVEYDHKLIGSGTLETAFDVIPTYKAEASGGRHEFFIRIEDSDGYRAEYVYHFYIDTPPKLEINYDVGLNDNNATLTLYVKVIDNEDTVHVFVYVNGTEAYYGRESVNVTNRIDLYLSFGSYEITVVAIDPYGLNASETFFITITPENPPEGSESSGSGGSSSDASDIFSAINSLVTAVILLIFAAILYELFLKEDRRET